MHHQDNPLTTNKKRHFLDVDVESKENIASTDREKRFCTNLLFNNNQFYEKNLLKNHNQWLIREASNKSSEIQNTGTGFTLAYLSMDKLVKISLKKMELSKAIMNKEFTIENNIKISLTLENQILPKENDDVSKKWHVTQNGNIQLEMIKLDDHIVNCFVHPWVNPQIVIDQMIYNAKPTIAIYRIAEPKEKVLCVGTDSPFSAYYEVAYLTNNHSIKTFKIKTYTNDPEEIKKSIDEIFIQSKFVHKSYEDTEKSEVKAELTTFQQAPQKQCSLIALHRNKIIYPEEKIHLLENLKETLIIALQTPSNESKQGIYPSDKMEKPLPGATSCEIKRILSKPDRPAFNQKWVIITGHHIDSDLNTLSGSYIHPFFPVEEIKFYNVLEIAKFILQCGYKVGDHINLLLYICKAGLSYDEKRSFAYQLASQLALYGISSTIVASKTDVGRFNGTYHDDEIKNECLKFRVANGPEDIIVVTGRPDDNNTPIIEEKFNEYPDGFFITSYGLGDKNILMNHINESKNNISNSKYN